MIEFKIYTSASQLPLQWDVLNKHDIMLQTAYLKMLDNASPNTITCYFIGVFKNKELVGTSLIQRAELYARDMFRKNGASKLKHILRDAFSLILKGNILVFGNLTHTGQHGYSFDVNKITASDFFDTIFQALDDLKFQIKQTDKKKIRLYLFKDYYEDDYIVQNQGKLKEMHFSKAFAQPNMVLNIAEDWNSKQDYLNALVAKYRKRYKTARKKAKHIQTIELNYDTIQKESSQIYALYKNVSDNAKFNTFILPINHFSELKKQLGENFRLYGYYLDNELIGFYTLILNNSTLETYFLGYDAEHQYKNQLYLNMLYDMIEFAIEYKFKDVIYARTAMEIKSSVGAKPYDMSMYLKHTNSFLNAILKQLFNLMSPKRNWEERNPFGK